jgi:hypothetical protein
MKLELQEVGHATLEAEARRHTLSPGEFVERAARYYLADRCSGRAAHPVPRFARERTWPSQERLAVEFDLEQQTWRELDAESERQGVPVERLLEHAALYLIADLGSGRVPGRIARDWTQTQPESPSREKAPSSRCRPRLRSTRAR